MITPQKSIHYEQYEFQKWKSFDAETIVETPMSLTVNGTVWITFMCTPVNLEALAVGFLYNEGIIEKMDEVSDVRVCEHGDNVDVWLNHDVVQPTSWRRTSGCTGGVTAVDILAKPNVSFDSDQFKVQPEAIGKLVEMLFESQSLYRETGGVHTSALSPERSSHPYAQRVHGLSDEFLAAKPRFAEVAEAFCEFVGGAELIIHNAAIDVGFLDAELQRVKRPGMATQVLRITDTLAMAREQYPGKANSLDALCRRLEVDNSQRTLHGALLDAGLLAEVYIRMTRGQDSLVIEHHESGSAGREWEAVDLRAFEQPVLGPTPEESTGHDAVLADLDKASGGKAILRGWRAGVCR